MPLREDLLVPIAGENPSGVDLRYDSELLYDKSRKLAARKRIFPWATGSTNAKSPISPSSATLPRKVWRPGPKIFNWRFGLTDALLHLEGFSGLNRGLQVCCGLVTEFWDSLYPPIEDGDVELRAAPFEWMSNSLELPLKSTPITARAMTI